LHEATGVHHTSQRRGGRVADSGHAQQPSRIWRVGFLSAAPATSISFALFEAFRLRLQELDYVEGRNLILVVRRSDGDSSKLPALAAELVEQRVDKIVTAASAASIAAKGAISSKPIVVISADVVELGLAQSLAGPGGNVTGIDVGGTRVALKLLDILNRWRQDARASQHSDFRATATGN